MNYISTGKAARLLSVTSDTVLKWIKKGKLAARRTAGGHYRIARDSVEALLAGGTVPPTGRTANGAKALAPCWEYHAADGKIKEECFSCLVFKVRGSRCYEIGRLLREKGDGATCCSTDCEECSYYKERHQRPINVLIFTNIETLENSLTKESASSKLRLKFTSCEYDCSLLVDSFRPEYVVIDCAKESVEFEELCGHLMTDPRIASVKIMLALPAGEKCEAGLGESVAVINHPFTLNDLEVFVENYDLLGRAATQ